MENLCPSCEKENDCTEPFPHDECENYEEKIYPGYVWKLFKGMSNTMQKSIIEIMRVTQKEK